MFVNAPAATNTGITFQQASAEKALIRYNNSNGCLAFSCGATTVDTLLINGTSRYVGIGTSGPDRPLEINASDGKTLRLTYNDTNGSAAVYTDFTSNATGLLINPIAAAGPTYGLVAPEVDNKVGLGGASNRWTQVYAVNGTIQTSDQNMKQEIAGLESGFAEAFLRKLKPVQFKWAYEKEEKDAEVVPMPDSDGVPVEPVRVRRRTHFGFTAQQVRDSLNETGRDAEDCGVYCADDLENGSRVHGLRYDQFVPVHTVVLQKLLERVDVLEQRLAAANL
jgi:hypothetical protein